MNRLNRSTINMLSSLLGYAVPMVISMVTTPIVLKALGITAYGLISLVNVVIGYLTVMDMGLDLPITKYLAEDRARVDDDSANLMLNNALQLYFIIGLLGMLVIIFTSNFFAYSVFKVPNDMLSDAVKVFQLAGIGFLGSVAMSWGRAVSMGVQRFEITHGVSIFTNLAGIFLGLLMIRLGYGVVGFVFMRVLLSLFAGIGYWIFVRHLLPFYRFKLGFDRNTLMRVRGYVGYGAINRIISGLVSGLDKTLISAWLGIAAAGIYSIPFMLVSSLGYMISYMLGFLLPISSELHSIGEFEKLREIFTRSTRFLTALTSMIFIPVLIFGDLFITLWVGAETGYKTKNILMLLALSGIFSTLFISLSNNIIVGIGRIKQFTQYCTIRAVVLSIGCFFLIKPFGIEGAGVALLLANVVDLFFLIIVLKNYLEISPLKLFRTAYFTPLVIGFSLSICTYFLRPIAHTWLGLTLSISSFEVIYIFISFKTGVFGETEKSILLNFFKKKK
jgi:O-antigen/teichoic acid export membrane protein